MAAQVRWKDKDEELIRMWHSKETIMRRHRGRMKEKKRWTITAMAEHFGVSRGAVAGRLDTLGLFPRNIREKQQKMFVNVVKAHGNGWSETALTEPWSVYRARKVRERQEAANVHK